ncbi:MAG TPA: hypothetical protein DEA22_13085, partial [Blastocatellia bacterium]|nr:hypothetical protein [Blastocatellia bacterium]
MKTKYLIFLAALLLPVNLLGQGSYKKPPKEILDVLSAAPIPATSISPVRDRIAILEPLRYPPISELAQPMLRLAGLRINPLNTTQHRQPYSVSLKFKTVADGKETPVAFPADVKLVSPQWSPDGR